MLAFATSAFMFLAIAAGAVAVFGPRQFGLSRSDDRIRGLGVGEPEAAGSSASPMFKRTRSSIPTLRRLLNDSAWAELTANSLQQANVHLRVGEYLLLRFLLSTVAFMLIALLTRFHPLGVLFGIFGAIGVYMLGPFYLRLLRNRRLAKIENQLVEFLPMLASSLRSGFAFQQGVELAAQQLDPPLADELTLMLNDANLGATMEEAMLQMGKRVGSTDLDMMITAVLVQRGTGGNLSEILERASETLRERESVRGDIQSLTASQRLTGLILSIYPVAIGLLLLSIMPSLWVVMFTETLGQIFLAVALGLQGLGFLVMQRVMKVDF
ncbi:MAG: type II secretion system F family protein [Chloroflexi bacterium]|nr:type II secretion system F family protein [Chloroflexota bacterium]